MAYNKNQIEQLWIQQGGNPKAAGTAAAVALAESSGKQSATNHNTNGTVDKGLFQINSIHGKLSTYDLAQNVRAAIKISQNGQNWTPWVTYKTGAYKKFLSSNPGRAPSTSTASGTNLGVGSPSAGTTTRTIPGKSFAAERGAAIQQFLGSGRNDSQNNLDFALQIRSLQDVPSRTVSSPATQGSAGPSDQAPPPGTPEFRDFAQKHSPLLELIHKTVAGRGYAVKNGRRVSGPQFYSSVWNGHADHVHVAAGPKTIIQLGKLAEKMGLRVGENPHFGGVAPVHVPGSYHYKGEAIDVSGDPRKMNQYAAEVERLYGIR